MSNESIDQKRLVLEEKKAQWEYSIRLKELDLQEKETKIKTLEANKKLWRNPVVLGLAAALLGLLGNIAVSIINGINTRQLEKEKFKSDVFLEAIKTGDVSESAKNLKFLVKIGLLEDKDSVIRNYLKDENNIPVLPPSSPRYDHGTGELNFENVIDVEDIEIKKLSKSVARLVSGKGSVCTAFLIAPGKIMTSSFCDTKDAYLEFGRIGPNSIVKKFKVNPNPIEDNHSLGYQILSVEGSPENEFGMLSLGTRSPINGEKIFILQFPKGEFLSVARDEDCIISGLAQGGSDRINYTCDTENGSSGSPVIALSDMKVLAIHQGKSSTVPGKYGTSMKVIIERSENLSR